ncbi:MAG: (d)CMP kinase [Gammaproteobacteria bacterium]|jgi:cytidylate kinase
MTSVNVITIDGPSGSGKGTVSRALAGRLGWHYLDSGSLYRLLACAALKHGIALDDEAALVDLAEQLGNAHRLPAADNPVILLDGEDVSDALRTEHCGNAASQAAALPGVRRALLDWQRRYRQPPGLVADGRDMGTVVFPEAILKVFLTARPDVRARRRHNQLKNKGINVDLASLVKEVEVRDARDAARRTSPLKPASDALVLDNSDLDAARTLAAVLEAVRGKL